MSDGRFFVVCVICGLALGFGIGKSLQRSPDLGTRVSAAVSMHNAAAASAATPGP